MLNNSKLEQAYSQAYDRWNTMYSSFKDNFVGDNACANSALDELVSAIEETCELHGELVRRGVKPYARLGANGNIFVEPVCPYCRRNNDSIKTVQQPNNIEIRCKFCENKFSVRYYSVPTIVCEAVKPMSLEVKIGTAIGA